MISACWLLAQQEGPGISGLASMAPSILILILLYFFLIARPQRQRETKHKELLANLKKNDRVVTIGGIYGVVTNVARDSDEVTIKVDEATNAKLRVTFGSIARVIGDDQPADKTAKT